jgi:hypothetical protein
VTAGDLVDEETALATKVTDLADRYNTCSSSFNDLVSRTASPHVAQAPVPQTPPTKNSDALAKYLLLRQLFPASQPYQLPMPTVPNNGVNCVTTHIGTTAYTNCH